MIVPVAPRPRALRLLRAPIVTKRCIYLVTIITIIAVTVIVIININNNNNNTIIIFTIRIPVTQVLQLFSEELALLVP